jgi:alpha-tubulin suppressor-like RCC1 family protein
MSLGKLVTVLASLAIVLPLSAHAQRHTVLHPRLVSASVSVFFGGPGGGRITTTKGQLNCSSNCTTNVTGLGRTLTVTLTGIPDANSAFAGWGGPICQGTQPTCVVTLAKSNNRVIAYFRSKFKTVAAGAYHTCVLRPEGDIVCWGKNWDGQLGRPKSASEAPGPSVNLITQTKPTFIPKAVAIAAGGYHTCALIVGEEVQCWGNNDYGQVSIPDAPVAFDQTTVVLPKTEAVALTAGGYHTCVVNAGGKASCWGHNANGQLGDNTTTDPKIEPVAVVGVGPLTNTITAGGFHTCAILASDSTVRCWGMNNDGQLGRGTNNSSESPGGASEKFNLQDLKAKAIAASIGVGQTQSGVFGGFHTVALDANGQDWGWGFNNNGEASTTTPGGQNRAVAGIFTIAPTVPPPAPTKIVAGAYHTCLLWVGVFCRGHNGNGESGPHPNTSDPVDAIPMTTGQTTTGAQIQTVDLAAGGYHTCAIVTGITADVRGSVICWGENGDGQVNGIPGANVNFPTLLLAP